jgi:hypothetical protein
VNARSIVRERSATDRRRQLFRACGTNDSVVSVPAHTPSRVVTDIVAKVL